MTDPRRLLQDPTELAELEQRVLTLGREARPSDDFARDLWSSLSAALPPPGGDPGGSPGSDGGGLGGADVSGFGAAGGSAASAGASTSATLGAKALVASIVKSSLIGAVLGTAVMTGAPLVTGAGPEAPSEEHSAALRTTPASPQRAEGERGSLSGSEAIAADRQGSAVSALEGELAPNPPIEPGSASLSNRPAAEGERAPSAARTPGASDPELFVPPSAGRAAPSVAAFSNMPGAAPGSNAAPAPGGDGTREESRLVAGARRALRSGDSRAALELLDRTEQRFPAGVLAQEREALAIEALVRSGRHDAAQQRAVAFLRAFPSSPHAARVRALVSP